MLYTSILNHITNTDEHYLMGDNNQRLMKMPIMESMKHMIYPNFMMFSFFLF